MYLKPTLLLLTTCLCVACNHPKTTPNLPQNSTNHSTQSFVQFYNTLRAEAQQNGHNPQLLDAAFPNGIEPLPQVLQAHEKQPEFIRTFANYVGPMLSANRIAQAQQNLALHRSQLTEIEEKTGVPATVLVALWGIETNFGKNIGTIPTIPALSTLAWKSPRRAYFKAETMAALQVLEQTKISPKNLQGSWAGAMGQCQFMPSNFLKYGRDGNADGKIDIWTTEADVFASSAAFLQAKGWQRGQTWRHILPQPVLLNTFKLNARGLSDPLTRKQLQAAHIKLPPTAGQRGRWLENIRYYHPQTSGPAYLLGPNFSVILKWNNSSYFAYAVLALADSIEPQGK